MIPRDKREGGYVEVDVREGKILMVAVNNAADF